VIGSYVCDIYIYIYTHIQVELTSKLSFILICLRTLIEQSRTEFYTSMYRAIIESSFILTNNSFDNQVELELSFTELKSSEFTSNFIHLWP